MPNLEFVKTKDNTYLIGLLMVVIFLSIPAIFVWVYYCEDVSVAWYEDAATMAEDSPELREDLRRYREDGILTLHEISCIKAKHRKLRKDEATRAFSEQ